MLQLTAVDLRALSFPASYLEAAELTLRKLGGDYDALLQRLGLDRAQLGSPSSRIDGVVLQAALELAVARCSTARPASIQLLEGFSLARHGVAGLLSLTADTLGAALEVFLPFLPQVMPAVRVERHDARGAIELRATLAADFGALNAVIIEMFFGGFLQILPFAEAPRGGHDFRFAHAARWPLASYQAYFGPRVQFEQAANTLHFDRSLLASKLSTRSAATHTQLRDALVESPLSPHGERVMRQVERALDRGESVELGAIARALGLSARTLSRRLQEEGTTLAERVGEARIARAERLLAQGDHTIAEIAARVGYRDTTSFSRAFKRARGRSPRTARRR